MIIKKLDTVWSPFVPSLVASFMQGDEKILDFVEHKPSLDAVVSYADQRIFSEEKRTLLFDTLSRQYATIGWSKQKVLDNIASLQDANTFTITTWQQVHAFLWPVFFVTKILDCIATAQEATALSKDKIFVPIFWMASEDHDFAEVRQVSVYGQSFDWVMDGVWWPVGRLSPASLDSMVQALRERLDDSELHDRYLDIFSYAYTTFPTLAQATHYILDALFGDKWLVVIDADDAWLKKSFSPVIAADIFSDQSHHALVEQTEKLIAAGFKKQAHPRDINVFFMTDSHRWRIIHTWDTYVVDGSDVHFTAVELAQKIQESPESFSPNVFLRPLYQETVLPNVLYIPWPAEFNYWLQMKKLFTIHNLIMPVLIPRTFNQFLSAKNFEKIDNGPIPLASYFSAYDVFLDAVRSVDTDTLSDTQELISSLESTIWNIQKDFSEKKISHKKITRSLHTIQQEIAVLRGVIDNATTATIEESENYAPYIKIKQKFFSLDDRFERNNSVIGQLSVIDALLHTDTIASALGKVVLYMYD